jgi:hypothetical protein
MAPARAHATTKPLPQIEIIDRTAARTRPEADMKKKSGHSYWIL